MGNQRMGRHCAELSEPWVGASPDEGRPKRPTATRTFRTRASAPGHAKKSFEDQSPLARKAGGRILRLPTTLIGSARLPR
jgi:hypothetical protein